MEGLTCAALIFPESSASRCRSRFSFFFFLPAPSPLPRPLPPASRASSGACRSAIAYLLLRAIRLTRFATSPLAHRPLGQEVNCRPQKPLAVSLQTSNFCPQSARTTYAKIEAWLSPSARHAHHPFWGTGIEHKTPLWKSCIMPQSATDKLHRGRSVRLDFVVGKEGGKGVGGRDKRLTSAAGRAAAYFCRWSITRACILAAKSSPPPWPLGPGTSSSPLPLSIASGSLGFCTCPTPLLR